MRLLRVGLTGGIGCGKSQVARLLRDHYKIPVIDMDQAGRDAVERAHVKAALRSSFPAHIYTSEGVLDRRALGNIVFADPTARAKLNEIVHPAMLEIVRERMQAIESAAPQVAYLVVDAALIFELAFEGELDTIVAVTAPLDICLQRAQKRDGLSILELQQRLQAQLPLAEKARRADYRLDNSGLMEDLAKQVADLHLWLVTLATQLSTRS
jgi:dephospho-CoA kinase